jgi:hypothetical protein
MAVQWDEIYFRAQYRFFTDNVKYPRGLLLANFTLATSYIYAGGNGWSGLQGNQQRDALFMMTAHLTRLNDLINENDGTAPALVSQAKIDKIAVTLNMPPKGSQLQWWLNLTPWGAMLYTLLEMLSVGGTYVGALPERAAFRRVGGGFGGCF